MKEILQARPWGYVSGMCLLRVMFHVKQPDAQANFCKNDCISHNLSVNNRCTAAIYPL